MRIRMKGLWIMMNKVWLVATAFLLSTCCVVRATAAPQPVLGQKTIVSSERILMGSIVAPDRSEIEPFVVLFRGERKETDGSGFFSFEKKADREAFEPAPFKQKMMQSLQKSKTYQADEEAISLSPMLSRGKADKFYLLITKDIEPVLEGTNDISGFRQIAGQPHLFFSCVVQNSDRPDEHILIKPTSIQKRNFLYPPDRTIVILMNPNRVSKLEYWPFKLDSQFIQLPRIVLLTEEEILARKRTKLDVSQGDNEQDEDTDEEGDAGQKAGASLKKANLARQSVKSHMYGLDVAPFFVAPDVMVASKRVGRNQLVVITL